MAAELQLGLHATAVSQGELGCTRCSVSLIAGFFGRWLILGFEMSTTTAGQCGEEIGASCSIGKLGRVVSLES